MLEAFIYLPLITNENTPDIPTSIISNSYAHLEHLPHYNSGGSRYSWGNYSSFIALDPEYGVAKQRPTAIEFSLQDRNNNDVYNITTMVEIYETATGNRVHVFPWTYHNIGDFILFYIFPQVGNYQIVLSVRDDNSTDSPNYEGNTQSVIGYADPPRTLLSNIKGCNCERTIFNISVSPSYGVIQDIMYAVIIILPLSVLGSILVWKYRVYRFDIRNRVGYKTAALRRDAVRYLVMLLAIGGGVVHLAVFQDHATIHVYYSLFLLAAAASQIAYGIIFVLVTLSRDVDLQKQEKDEVYTQTGEYNYMKQKTYRDYKKKMTIDLFGLFGTCVLIGLYLYSVILPPPLSPINRAEQVDIEGISAKLLELFLVIGIIVIIKWDREEIKNKLVHISNK
jgi:hypothetical protein